MAHNTESTASTATARSLAGLGEVEKRVLSYAAAMGKEFDFSVLAVAIEMDEEPLAEVLERLVHLGVLKELKGGDSYTFVRSDTLAQAYGDISSSRLRVVHKKIAEAYEKLYPDPTPAIIPEMGRHYHLGRLHDKSLICNRYAARLAVNAFSPDVAIRHLERAREDLAALPGDHRLEEADILKEIGEQNGAMGDNAKANEFYGESLKKLPEEEVTLRALLLLSRADANRMMDKLVLTREYCGEALKLLEKMGHKKGLAMTHRILAQTAFKEGSYDIAKKEIETTLRYFDPEKDIRDLAVCYIDLGNVYSEGGEPGGVEKALDYYRRAISTIEPIHDYHELSRAHNNLAITLMPAHPQEAKEEIKKAQEYSEKAKDRRGLGWRLFNSVDICLALGQVDEAVRDNEEAGKILSLLNDPFGVEQVALNKGIIAQYRKSFEESEKEYLAALKRAEALGYPPVVTEVLIHMAMMYFEWGRKEEASIAINRIKAVGGSHVSPTYQSAYENLKTQLGL